MNRDQLIGQFPPAHGWHQRSSMQKKKAVEDSIELVLQAIEAEDRQPDRWEADDIAAAIGYTGGRMYTAALVMLERALAPENERAPFPASVYEVAPATLAALREAFVEVQKLAARAY